MDTKDYNFDYKKYFVSLLGILIFCFFTGYVVSDYPSFKWTSYRYCIFLSIILSYLYTYFSTNKHFLGTQLLTFLIASTGIPMLLKVFKNLEVVGSFVWDEISVGLLVVTFVALIHILAYKIFPTFSKIIVTGLQIFLVLPYVLASFYSFSTGDVIDTNSLIALYQTNFEEVKEFIFVTITALEFCAIIVILFVVTFALYVSNKNIRVYNVNFNKLTIFIFVVLIGTSYSLVPKVLRDSYFNRIVFASQEYVATTSRFLEMRMDSNGEFKHFKVAVENSDIDSDATYVVVIGESQNKNHMSVYGYSRETTPWLNAMRKTNEFIFFENAYACHTLTMEALSKSLTESSQYNSKSFARSYSIVDVAKTAGFKTYWISNQSKFGTFSTPISAIASVADEQVWLSGDIGIGNVYDEKIVDVLNQIEADNTKKVIFIHLYGNHWEYKNRYPNDKFNKFDGLPIPVDKNVKDLTKLNEYDNSILYNDFVISKIFEKAQDKFNLYGMIYFSDHGEAVKSDRKHIPGLFEMDMVEIPTYIYLSERYKEVYPEKFEFISLHRNVYFTNDMMYDAMLNVFGLKTAFYSKEHDFLSPDYSYDKKDLMVLDGKFKVVK